MKTFLEITDMPTDSNQVLGKLRTVLVGTFNKCREYPYKMALLKSVLKFMYNKCVEFEKHEVAKLETVARNKILAEASELNFDLDERLSTDKLVAELETLKAATKEGAK